MNEKTPILRAEGFHKWFGKVHALADFSFQINPGEAVGLVGDNGAGKSTFAKILSGAVPPSRGELFWEGKKTEIKSIQDARTLGIETVYQEQALVDQLNVAKNIFLGREIAKAGALGVLDEKEMEKQAKEVTEELGLHMAPTQEVRFCSGGERQGVAVARAILFRAKAVILDEPTRGLSASGVTRILDLIRGMKEEGIAVIVISHIFPQIYPITDRFVVMSRGKKIKEMPHDETSPEELTKMLTELTVKEENG